MYITYSYNVSFGDEMHRGLHWFSNLSCTVYDATTIWRFTGHFSEGHIIYKDITTYSAATCFRCGGTCDHYFITHLLLSLLWKNFSNSSTFGKVMGTSWLPQAPCAPEQCLAERWRTRLRSDVWRAGTVVTASRYDKYPSLTLTPWSTNIRLALCQTLVTRRLMPSMTERSLCAQ